MKPQGLQSEEAIKKASTDAGFIEIIRSYTLHLLLQMAVYIHSI